MNFMYFGHFDSSHVEFKFRNFINESSSKDKSFVVPIQNSNNYFAFTELQSSSTRKCAC